MTIYDKFFGIKHRQKHRLGCLGAKIEAFWGLLSLKQGKPNGLRTWLNSLNSSQNPCK